MSTFVPSSEQPAAQKHPKNPRAEQMERGAVAESHLLGYSMIHMATDDGYSISPRPTARRNTHIHTQIDDEVSANLSIRHASLSETAAQYLISRSDLGLSFTARALGHPTSAIHACTTTVCTFCTFLCMSWFHTYQSYQMCWASYTFTRCLWHNERDYVTVHRWSSATQNGNSAAWEKNNLPMYCVPHVKTDVGCVYMYSLCSCPPPATILNWSELWPWWYRAKWAEY